MNSKVRVTSFDGSKYLADTLTDFISSVLPQPNIPVGHVDSVIFTAVISLLLTALRAKM